MTFKQVRTAGDFITNYPFVPYQFQLLQKIFESIRKVGATGLHLAQGERSLLDAFQSAGKAVAGCDVGVAVPLYLFYPSIESFLDTGVKRTIDHARENDSLEDFDAHVLEVLFLIRYVYRPWLWYGLSAAAGTFIVAAVLAEVLHGGPTPVQDYPRANDFVDLIAYLASLGKVR